MVSFLKTEAKKYVRGAILDMCDIVIKFTGEKMPYFRIRDSVAISFLGISVVCTVIFVLQIFDSFGKM